MKKTRFVKYEAGFFVSPLRGIQISIWIVFSISLNSSVC